MYDGFSEFVEHVGNDWGANSQKVHLRFIALPVSERTLPISIEAPQHEFDSFVSDAESVLATVRFFENSQ